MGTILVMILDCLQITCITWNCLVGHDLGGQRSVGNKSIPFAVDR